MGAVKHVLGIDIGGSGIKGALVDIEAGGLATERYRLETPQPATPEAVAETVGKIVAHFAYSGPIGCTFPAIVRHGVTLSAANVDKSWIGTDADALFSRVTGLEVHLLNDADAAGEAEMRFGAGRGRSGTVIMLTFGTGIGSAVFLDGKLLPNTEFGHLYLEGGQEAEAWASDRARKLADLSWKKWAARVQTYLKHLEFLFSPDLFIVGGGVSKKSDKFLPLLELGTEVVAAELRNEAGIVGAALAVARGAREG
ncbi:polyphosphate--glucose phosphotransferase [Truepera radiovictrix]|uniref:ROK family protein n=1 Tax=Truepera radiovictrix (strain DSM 17093 / CIP 108686 / LMG 22925 / RQ-24) TaxID=649638 RepID=D7CW85_TRURR|nr:ROK family protein [Truepera radiovictrix DSM 17093]